MKLGLIGVCVGWLGCQLVPAAAMADAPECKTPRFADVGWTDISLTTALTAGILEGLGYEPKIDVLGSEVAYAAMQSGDLDIFLGTWIPGLSRAAQPYYDNGSIETLAVNLTGAKFTLAVPKFVYDAGVRSFVDLAKFKDKFDGKIFGVEPGGNRPIEDMIAADAFGLGDWELVESSEQGMLSEVDRRVRRKDWIVFLAWAPHPMNRNYEIEYLSGGDDYYGPNFGASVVHTDVRKGYPAQCPNVARLLKNIEFSVDSENVMMDYVLNQGMEPRAAAVKWLASDPEWLEQSLTGVTTIGNEPPLPAVKAHLELP